MTQLILKIIRWIIGIFFALTALIEFSDKAFVSGISSVLLTILFIPPLAKYAFSKINRPVSTKNKAIAGALLFFIMTGTASSSTSAQPDPVPEPIVETVEKQTPEPTPEIITYEVVTVTDGDTFKVDVDGKIETVRLVGINTPETVDPRKPVECFGKEASDKLKSLLTGQRVVLRLDDTQSDKDRYGRLLRFAIINYIDDVGLIMIGEGYAQEFLYSTVPHFQHNEYVQAQKKAQEEKRGLWADNACPTPTPKPTTIPTPTPTTTSTPAPIPVSTIVPTSTVVPTAVPAGTNTRGGSCNGPDLDCADFSTHAEAQAFFDGCGFTIQNDPMRLDSVGIGDGVACESLP